MVFGTRHIKKNNVCIKYFTLEQILQNKSVGGANYLYSNALLYSYSFIHTVFRGKVRLCHFSALKSLVLSGCFK